MQARDHRDASTRLPAGPAWDAGKTPSEAVVAETDSADVLDARGRAQWWSKDVPAAIQTRARAYVAYKTDGRIAEAAAVAVWLARELRTLLDNDAAADGWLARAETLSADLHRSAVPGWVSLARAEATTNAADSIALCQSAVMVARSLHDADLEIVALGRLGLLELARGAVDAGIRHLDEAMAAASAGEASDLQTVGEAYCALMDAAELLGDPQRFGQWVEALSMLRPSDGFGPLDGVGASAAHGSLSTFCGACCGAVYLVTGRLDDAEVALRAALSDLESSGLHARCVHPVTQLAELRVLQGRLEEAHAMLEPYEDLPESVRALAVLDLALGSPDSAAARLSGRLHDLRDLPVAALPLWSVLLDAHIARGDLAGAADAAEQIETVAALTQSKRHAAEALLGRGKVAAAHGHAHGSALLHEAARAFSEASMALPACRARMELAGTLAGSDRPLAISEARAALAAFERLGAIPDADAASAFLRDLGVKGRTGPKNLQLLSKREVEVLRLVAQGLSNAEVAERLFISVKTAGHHVSSILSKLGLRSRTEAAAYAALNLVPEQVRK